VLAPPRFVAGIVEEQRLSCRGASRLDQEALALFMESGRFDRHVRRVREIYRGRRDVLAAEAELAWGPGRLHGLEAGCHALLSLPDGTSERAVVATAATMGVRVNGLGHYRFVTVDAEAEPAPRPPALVLGFGNVGERQIRRGIRTLAQAVRQQTTGSRSRRGGSAARRPAATTAGETPWGWRGGPGRVVRPRQDDGRCLRAPLARQRRVRTGRRCAVRAALATVPLDQAVKVAERVLAGAVRGRTVVDVKRLTDGLVTAVHREGPPMAGPSQSGDGSAESAHLSRRAPASASGASDGEHGVRRPDALLQHGVGELPVRQGTRELHRADHHRVES